MPFLEEKSVKSKDKSVSWESTSTFTKMSYEIVFSKTLISSERGRKSDNLKVTIF
jgi:hypothetical protein